MGILDTIRNAVQPKKTTPEQRQAEIKDWKQRTNLEQAKARYESALTRQQKARTARARLAAPKSGMPMTQSIFGGGIGQGYSSVWGYNQPNNKRKTQEYSSVWGWR